MTPVILLEDRGDATWITLNRPEVRNALNLDVLKALLAALEEAAASPTRTLVITGAGSCFSSGGDIQDMVQRRGQAIATTERLKTGLVRLVDRITRFPKPVIARVEGDAIGAGLGLALSCDLLLCTQKSRFGVPFARIGLIPDTGTSWLLPHIVGIQQARRLLLSGDLLAAEEAAGMGLVTQVLHDATLLDAAVQEWTAKFAAMPPTALADVKRLLWENLHQPLNAATYNEALLQGIRFTTDEHARAVDSFLAKRKGGAP